HTRSKRKWSSDVCSSNLTMNYVHIQEKFEYKNKTGENFNVEEHYGVRSYTTIINRTLKEKYGECEIPSDLLEQAVRESINVFNRSEERRVGKERKSR